MITTDTTLFTVLLPLLTIVAGGVIGFIVERIIIARATALANKTSWEGDDVVIRSVHGLFLFIGALVGVYYAVGMVEVSPEVELYVTRGLKIAGILIVALCITRLVNGFIRLYTQSGETKNAGSVSVVTNLTTIAIFGVAALLILEVLQQDLAPLLTAFGVGGIAVALGLQDTLSSLFSGINILASKKINVGDYIELNGDTSGFINDINWRYTSLRDLAGNTIVVPNSILSKEIITNFTQPSPTQSVIIVTQVAYDTDLDRAEAVIKDVARITLEEMEGQVADSEPIVRFTEFADSGITTKLFVRSKQFTDQFALKSALVKNLHVRFTEEKIEIPYPTQVHIQAKQK